jgi:hypothetical protein
VTENKRNMGADIEIVEEITNADALPAIKPREVYVNGTHVGLLVAGGLEIDPGPHGQGPENKGLQVTLRLLPRSVRIYARDPQEEEK